MNASNIGTDIYDYESATDVLYAKVEIGLQLARRAPQKGLI